jgi:hypothetical protein
MICPRAEISVVGSRLCWPEVADDRLTLLPGLGRVVGLSAPDLGPLGCQGPYGSGGALGEAVVAAIAHCIDRTAELATTGLSEIFAIPLLLSHELEHHTHSL